MSLMKIGDRIINLDHVRDAIRARKGAPGKTPDGADAPIRRDAVSLSWSDGRTAILWDADALAAWDHLERRCPEVLPGERTPAAVRRAELAELAAIAESLRIAEAAMAGVSPYEVGHLADRLESVRASLAGEAGADDEECDPRDRDEDTLRAEDDQWPAQSYRILDPLGRRSGPAGDVLAEARDLGALRDAAERISRTRADSDGQIFPVIVTGDPDPDGTWGELRIVGPGRWHLCSHDGSVTILPGAIIL